MRTKNSARDRINILVYPDEWKLLKNEKKRGDTMADVVKRLIAPQPIRPITDEELDSPEKIQSWMREAAPILALKEMGASEVYSCCAHPIFSGPAVERIASSPVREVVVTDTVPVMKEKRLDKITVLPVAPLIGEAIHRIHTGQSVGAMFK